MFYFHENIYFLKQRNTEKDFIYTVIHQIKIQKGKKVIWSTFHKTFPKKRCLCTHEQRVHSQLSISNEHVWVSRGNRLRSMLHIAVTVTLQTQNKVEKYFTDPLREISGSQIQYLKWRGGLVSWRGWFGLSMMESSLFSDLTSLSASDVSKFCPMRFSSFLMRFCACDHPWLVLLPQQTGGDRCGPLHTVHNTPGLIYLTWCEWGAALIHRTKQFSQ